MVTLFVMVCLFFLLLNDICSEKYSLCFFAFETILYVRHDLCIKARMYLRMRMRSSVIAVEDFASDQAPHVDMNTLQNASILPHMTFSLTFYPKAKVLSL